MGVLHHIAETVMDVSLTHTAGCPNKEIAARVKNELDTYVMVMEEKFENAQSKEERVKYVNEACQAKFWTENMLEGFEKHVCQGCFEVMQQYATVPLYVICGVDERADKNKATRDEVVETLKPLHEKSQWYSDQMETLIEKLTENQMAVLMLMQEADNFVDSDGEYEFGMV